MTFEEPTGATSDLRKIANLLALLLVRDMTKTNQTLLLKSAGFSNKEISALTGAPESSIRKMLSDANKGKRAAAPTEE